MGLLRAYELRLGLGFRADFTWLLLGEQNLTCFLAKLFKFLKSMIASIRHEAKQPLLVRRGVYGWRLLFLVLPEFQ